MGFTEHRSQNRDYRHRQRGRHGCAGCALADHPYIHFQRVDFDFQLSIALVFFFLLLLKKLLDVSDSGIGGVQFSQGVGVLTTGTEQSCGVSDQADDDHRPDGDDDEHQRQDEARLVRPDGGILGGSHGKEGKRQRVIADTL